MPKQQKILDQALTAGGGTINFSVDDYVDIYRLYSSGAVTLTSNYTIQASGTPAKGMEYTFRYEANLDFNGNTLTIFGATVPTDLEAINSTITATYDGSAWVVRILPDFETVPFISSAFLETDSVTATQIATGAVDTDELAAGAVTTAKIDANAVTNSELGAGSVTATELGALAVTTAKINTAAVDSTKLATSAVSTGSIATGAVTTAKLDSGLKADFYTIPVSFETGEQANYEITIPYNFTIEEVNYVITKAIAATDAATITYTIAGVPTTPGSTTIPLSTAINSQGTTTFTAANTGVSGNVFRCVTAKTTAGGKALLTLKISRR